jgi:Uma2 family endonuclease
MSTVVVEHPLTLEQFLAGDYESYEYVQGKLIPMAAAKLIHGKISSKLIIRLGRYIEDRQLGELYTNETVFKIDGRGRKPDVAYIAEARIPDDLWQEFDGAPDLAVEVVSPTDALKEIHEKAFEYLDAGCRLVWVVEPFSQTVMVYRSRTDIRLLTINDVLTGEEVVEGFSCPVAEVFR